MNLFADPLDTYPSLRRTLRPDADGTIRRCRDLNVKEADPTVAQSYASHLRQMLHAHHGRDKLFKVVQYSLRLYLWGRGIEANVAFIPDADDAQFTAAERTLMTITNTRRMFKLFRFVGEFARARLTLARIAALVDLQRQYPPRTLAWLQLQMVLDVIARLVMCVKSVLDDLGWAARKGFLHSRWELYILNLAGKLSLPALSIDLFLNTVRLAQGIVDAAAPLPSAEQLRRRSSAVASIGAMTSGSRVVPDDDSPTPFSLLSTYDELDRIRRDSCSQEGVLGVSSRSPVFPSTPGIQSPASLENVSSGIAFCGPSIPSGASGAPRQRTLVVHTYHALLWRDVELRWIMLHQIKLILDLIVAGMMVAQVRSSSAMAATAVCGIASGMISVSRVWVNGR
jgi:hypothetical protein